MDESNEESDLSMSPSQILERLQMLRQLQLLQRGKLQKQQLSYQDASEISSSITEIVSHFTNSTSYNTFRSLLQSHQGSSNEGSPRQKSNSLNKVEERDYIDGVSVLNLSQESELVINSPTSVKSKNTCESGNIKSPRNYGMEKSSNKQISLDEMPILTPKKNFEALVVEKLKTEDVNKKDKDIPKHNIFLEKGKKPFLKRGEGMSRFGLQKKDLVIQDTKSLPWHQKQQNMKCANAETKRNVKRSKVNLEKVNIEIKISKPATLITNNEKTDVKVKEKPEILCEQNMTEAAVEKNLCKSTSDQHENKIINLPKLKHPLQTTKGKTWAAILTKEQDNFLRQLKQSDYYKNFNSPTKSVMSDISCDSNIDIEQNKETAEQRMFELLETKVTNDSFHIENSFINRFLRRTKLECSGESTPLVFQRCLTNNPDLLHINHDEESKNSGHESETCDSECTECVETCSTLSSCCSCVTIEPANANSVNYKDVTQKRIKQVGKHKKSKDISKEKNTGIQNKEEECHNDKVMDVTDDIKTNMAEMNAKLVATSELLKERLSELEDEIETFRKENASLSKMREEIDLERQKFFEEKAAYEQKFNEEKILSEYYIAEEKEKLTKQKQLYERYVRDMRGRLNKKEKDEVTNLKKEITDLKDEIKLKDAKSTSTIARLRNQLKIMEKEKKTLQDEMENLRKENRRIQHSNDVTRRLTNLKYLEQINKKLTGIATKESHSEVNLDPDVKYKAFEIERQSRARKVQSQVRGARPRAKSVPNLKVTSRYAKYFSQKDSLSEIERNKTLNFNELYTSPNDSIAQGDKVENLDHSLDLNSNRSISDSDDENNLEKIYVERFQNSSPTSKRRTLSNSSDNSNTNDEANTFFIQKSKPTYNTNSSERNPKKVKDFTPNMNYESTRNSSAENTNVSSESIKSHLSIGSRVRTSNPYNLSKSPISVISNYSSTQKAMTVLNKNYHDDIRMNVTPEPSTSRSSLTKTNLNPTEIIKPDGSRELKFPNGNVKLISADGTYSKFVYYNGDVKENFYNEGRIKYFYAEKKTFHTTHADGLEVLEFADGQVEKRYKDGSSEIRLPNGSVRYFDPKNEHVREEWRFPDGSTLTVNANGEQRVVFSNGQIEVHAKDHKRREFPDGTVKLVYNDGTAETRYASGRVRIKDKHGNLIMDSACR